MTSPHPCREVWTSLEPRVTSVDFTGLWNNITTGGPIRYLEVANDGLSQHPSDANDATHLDFVASTEKASKSPVQWMPSGSGYKMVAEPRLFLSQQMDFKEASAPVNK